MSTIILAANVCFTGFITRIFCADTGQEHDGSEIMYVYCAKTMDIFNYLHFNKQVQETIQNECHFCWPIYLTNFLFKIHYLNINAFDK